MSTSSDDEAKPDSIEAARAEVARDREQLVQTINELSARLDVKSRTRERIQDARTQTTNQVAVVRDRLTTDEGRPTQAALIAVGAGTVVVVALVVLLVRRGGRR